MIIYLNPVTNTPVMVVVARTRAYSVLDTLFLFGFTGGSLVICAGFGLWSTFYVPYTALVIVAGFLLVYKFIGLFLRARDVLCDYNGLYQLFDETFLMASAFGALFIASLGFFTLPVFLLFGSSVPFYYPVLFGLVSMFLVFFMFLVGSETLVRLNALKASMYPDLLIRKPLRLVSREEFERGLRENILEIRFVPFK